MNSKLDLNNPDTRQNLLYQTIKSGGNLVAKEIASKLDVSLDTIRRDLIALEKQGLVRRVKGGAIPVSEPTRPFIERVYDSQFWLHNLPEHMPELLEGVNTVFLDGGTSVLEFASHLPYNFSGLVITPSPIIASTLLQLNVETLMIGGTLCPSGAITTGVQAVQAIRECHADLCVLGACSVNTEFGLSADILAEAMVKKAMAESADKTLVLASQDKFTPSVRHRVLPLNEIDLILTDASVHNPNTYQEAEVELLYL